MLLFKSKSRELEERRLILDNYFTTLKSAARFISREEKKKKKRDRQTDRELFTNEKTCVCQVVRLQSVI